MRTIPVVLAAGIEDRKIVTGRYFRLMETSGPVDVELLRDGRVVYEASQVEAGFWATPEGGFSEFIITSATTQTIKIAVSLGGGGYDRSSGNVNATLVTGAALSDLGNVTVGTSLVTAVSAFGNRRSIIFRAPLTNTAPIYLGGGITTTAIAAVVLEPGDSFTAQFGSQASWSAISTAAGQTLQRLSVQ